VVVRVGVRVGRGCAGGWRGGCAAFFGLLCCVGDGEGGKRCADEVEWSGVGWVMRRMELGQTTVHVNGGAF